jgi:hypothetical protein
MEEIRSPSNAQIQFFASDVKGIEFMADAWVTFSSKSTRTLRVQSEKGVNGAHSERDDAT